MACRAVYYKLTRTLIDCVGLQTLSYCRHHSVTSDLPSWVPDWSSPPLPKPWWDQKVLFNVAPDSCPSSSFHPKSSLEIQEVLEVLGVQVDSIRAVGMVGSDLSKNAAVFLSNFAKLVELTGNFYTTNDKCEAAWRTPIADHERSSGEVAARPMNS